MEKLERSCRMTVRPVGKNIRDAVKMADKASVRGW
jgi:hypothetical protein